MEFISNNNNIKPSASLNFSNRVMVYTPCGYDLSTVKATVEFPLVDEVLVEEVLISKYYFILHYIYLTFSKKKLQGKI